MSFLRIKVPGTLDPGVERPILLEPWTPDDLDANLLAWFDPTSGVDGATVSQWNDESGHARHLNAITGSPTFDADGLDGTPAVVLAGSSYMKTASFTSVLGQFTLIGNGKITGAGTGYLVDGHGSNVHSIYRSPSSNVFGARRSASSAAITSAPGDSLAHSFIFVTDGASSKFYVDGVEHTGVEQGVQGVSLLTVGSNGAGTASMVGAVGDIVWASGALDAETCARANAWLQYRRGA